MPRRNTRSCSTRARRCASDDRNRLAARAPANDGHIHLALWVEYWELSNRLGEAQQPELDAFYARWSGTYVEDRLRNDWLLELGRRRDWANFSARVPALSHERRPPGHLLCAADRAPRRPGRARGRAHRAWLAQREVDDGCPCWPPRWSTPSSCRAADIWKKARLCGRGQQARVRARAAAGAAQPGAATSVGEMFDNPARYLHARPHGVDARRQPSWPRWRCFAWPTNDADAAAGQLNERWQSALPRDLAPPGPGPASAGRPRCKLQPEAADATSSAPERAGASAQADARAGPTTCSPGRCARRLRADGHAALAAVMQRDRRDERGRAEGCRPGSTGRRARCRRWPRLGAEGETLSAGARTDAERSPAQLHFYGKLAAEDLGQPKSLPPKPTPLTRGRTRGGAAQPGLRAGHCR